MVISVPTLVVPRSTAPAPVTDKYVPVVVVPRLTVPLVEVIAAEVPALIVVLDTDPPACTVSELVVDDEAMLIAPESRMVA